jgi:rubrerythrin
MFSVKDLCDIAIQIERNGEAVYREVGKRATDTRVADMLLQLAEDEAQHAKWFENLAVRVAVISDAPQLESAGRAILQGMMEHQTFSLDQENLTNVEQINEVIAQSILFEEDTILFYEMIGGFIDDEAVLGHLETIIEEERSHVKWLNTLLPENLMSQMES